MSLRLRCHCVALIAAMAAICLAVNVVAEETTMRVPLQDSYEPLSEESLNQFSARTGITLPPDYRQLLLARNGGWFDHSEICPIRDAQRYRADSIGLESLNGINTGESFSDLERAIENAPDYRFPPTLLPIGSAVGGDPILLGLDEIYRGKVYLWDREGGDAVADCLFLIADSLEQFLDSIHEDPDVVPDEQLPIFRAAETGDVEGLENLLRRFPIDVRNEHGRTLLTCAARHRRLNVLVLLLNRGADVSAHGTEGETALYRAAVSHSVDGVKLLLEHGAEIDGQTNSGETALIGSIVRLGVRIPKLLIARGADVNIRTKTGATALSVCKHVELRKLLVEAGAVE